MVLEKFMKKGDFHIGNILLDIGIGSYISDMRLSREVK